MPKVYLKDVVTRIKDKVDKDNTDLEFYIGGEHFDSGEIQITKRGVIAGSTIGPAFHMRFVPGDVLLMSRNPHLRKAGVVDFEGICSDVSYVCRTKDENILMQKFLPFIFQSADFWKFAEENKKGSTNFFLNWSDFEKYEFTLPDIETQKKLVEMLWAFEDTKTAYKKLLEKTDELVKSQFIEMFGDPVANPNRHPVKRLTELGELNRGVSKSRPRNKPELLGGPYPLVQTGEVTAAELYITSYENTYSELGLAQSKMWPKGTLCITIAANIAQTAILGFDSCFPDSVVGFIPGKEVTQIYIHYWFGFFQKILEEQAPQVAQKNINLKILSGLQVIVPSMDLQEQFIDFVRQSDKSKFIDFKSQFIEMFGDPTENPMGWPMRKLSEIAKVDGTMTKEYERYANYPHIGIDSIEKNTGILSGYRTVQEDNVISPKYYFGPQHILYSKIRPALNKVALPDFEGLCSADCYPLLIIDKCDRMFLAHVLRSEYFLDYILSYSGRSQMPKVNRKQLEGFEFPCPPMELQEKFTVIIEQSDKSK